MREFAEQEVVIPKGPFAKRLFQCSRQPYSEKWFELVDSGLWNRHFATGPTQSGKTFCCFVIPAMFHLFEIQDESVVLLAPKMEINRDKWNDDLLPAIQASKYRDLLPTKGPGSEGGFADSIRFKNGTVLKFMTGGGDDKNRASFTTRVVIVTEVDGMDTASEASRETDPITQTEARTLSHGRRKRIYGECTVSIESGRTWQELTNGTNTRLAIQCHSCKAHVSPEREDLFGWHDAENIIEARERSSFVCPSCGVLWSDQQRRAANRKMIVVHRGQEIVDGEAVGELPKTDTLGFRWNACNNLFWDTADIGADEWKASKSPNVDNAEKEQLQFKWAKPYKPDIEATFSIDVKTICARSNAIPQKAIPAQAEHFAIGLDIGMYWSHWTALAAMPGGGPHVVDYGEIEVHSRTLGLERAIMACLREFHDMVSAGWAHDGNLWVPDQAIIDSGYQGDVVHQFVNEIGGGKYWAGDGRGEAQDGQQGYHHPTQLSNKILLIGEQYHASMTPKGILLAMDANHWKTWVHTRLSTPMGKPGAMSLFAADGATHVSYAKHLTAERQLQVFKPGKGQITVWDRIHKANHKLDATYMASVGLHLAGSRLIEVKPIVIEVKPQKPDTASPFVRTLSRSDASGGWVRRRSNAET